MVDSHGHDHKAWNPGTFSSRVAFLKLSEADWEGKSLEHPLVEGKGHSSLSRDLRGKVQA